MKKTQNSTKKNREFPPLLFKYNPYLKDKERNKVFCGYMDHLTLPDHLLSNVYLLNILVSYLFIFIMHPSRVVFWVRTCQAPVNGEMWTVEVVREKKRTVERRRDFIDQAWAKIEGTC